MQIRSQITTPILITKATIRTTNIKAKVTNPIKILTIPTIKGGMVTKVNNIRIKAGLTKINNRTNLHIRETIWRNNLPTWPIWSRISFPSKLPHLTLPTKRKDGFHPNLNRTRRGSIFVNGER